MRLLLDTQIFLWFLADSRRLKPPGRRRIREADVVYVSAASVWEASIKIALGKLDVDIDEVVTQIPASGFVELPVAARHAAAVAALPRLHDDPFDRLLVAQAMTEPLHLLTADEVLTAYSPLVELVSQAPGATWDAECDLRRRKGREPGRT
jgi:PIN domain nuclease of toxin-antitoxin system